MPKLIWLNPEENRKLLWNYNFSVKNSTVKLDEAKELLASALKKPLSLEITNTLREVIHNDKQIILQIMSPEQLVPLIEYNPPVATEVLLQLFSTPHINEYDNFLVDYSHNFIHF